MFLEVRELLFQEVGSALQDKQILGVLFLSCLREIERPGNDRRLVNDDDLVVRNSVLVVDEGRNTDVAQESG